MVRSLLTACVLATTLIVGSTVFARSDERVADGIVPIPPAADPAVERGAYLVRTMGCHDCHTPFVMGTNGPEPDMSRALTGHPQDVRLPPTPALPDGWGWIGAATNTAFAGPWGVSFTANLTPDPDTGLGNWTVDMFIAALRTGRHQGRGRPILPPMPWPVYGQATDADLTAIFAYLRSLPPVRNRVPAPLDPVTDAGQ